MEKRRGGKRGEERRKEGRRRGEGRKGEEEMVCMCISLPKS